MLVPHCRGCSTEQYTCGLKPISSPIQHKERGIIGFTFRGTVSQPLHASRLSRGRKKKEELKASEGGITLNLENF
jgi:hypothetical protein